MPNDLDYADLDFVLHEQRNKAAAISERVDEWLAGFFDKEVLLPLEKLFLQEIPDVRDKLCVEIEIHCDSWAMIAMMISIDFEDDIIQL